MKMTWSFGGCCAHSFSGSYWLFACSDRSPASRSANFPLMILICVEGDFCTFYLKHRILPCCTSNEK